MPRRNLHWLFLIALVSMTCYQKVPASRFGRVIADAVDHVHRHYYKPVDDLSLFEGAMDGMMNRLDKNSVYISAAGKSEFEEGINKEFAGLGIAVVLDPETKQLIVLRPLLDSPAHAAGVRAGDRIVKIEGTGTQSMSLQDAVERLRGKVGSPVTISIQHCGAAQAVDLTLVRKVIHEDTVQGESRTSDGNWIFMLGGRDGIGYIRIAGFAEAESDNAGERSTVADLKAALEPLAKQHLRGLVLDLRGNPGGSLRSAVEVCDLLVSSGEIVTTRDREGRTLHAYLASGKAPYTGFPIATLVNGNSASASEIVAACLQDHGRSVVIGQRSYGKGTVQEVIDMGHSLGVLKLTIATYWRPSGKNIDRRRDDPKNTAWGVSPDEGYEVPVDKAERERLERWRQDRELAQANGAKAAKDSKEEVPDRVLLKAVEYLEK